MAIADECPQTCWSDRMSPLIPDSLDAMLPRDRTAEILTVAGFPIRAKTLATMATRGGGPPYHRFGAKVLYRWGDALAWARSRLSAPIGNTTARRNPTVAMGSRSSEPPVRFHCTISTRSRRRGPAYTTCHVRCVVPIDDRQGIVADPCCASGASIPIARLITARDAA